MFFSKAIYFLKTGGVGGRRWVRRKGWSFHRKVVDIRESVPF